MRSLPFTHTAKRVLSFGPPAIAATLVLLAAMSSPTSVNASDAATASKARTTESAHKVAPPASSAFTYDALGATPKVQPPHVRRAVSKEVKASDPALAGKTAERAATKTPPQPTP